MSYQKKTNNPNMGRPKKEINQKIFENLCGLQCTITEVCYALDVDETTLENWCKETYDGMTFSKVFAIKRGSGLISLRRNQWKLSEKNPSMAIFLGKQYLGQKDVIETEGKDYSKVEELLSKIKEEAHNDIK